jgi:hypothetical protein
MSNELANFRRSCALIASLLAVDAVRPHGHALLIALDYLVDAATRRDIDRSPALDLIMTYLDDLRIDKLAFVPSIESQQLIERLPGARLPKNGFDVADMRECHLRGDWRPQEYLIQPPSLFGYLLFLRERDHASARRLIALLDEPERQWLGNQLRELRSVDRFINNNSKRYSGQETLPHRMGAGLRAGLVLHWRWRIAGRLVTALMCDIRSEDGCGR